MRAPVFTLYVDLAHALADLTVLHRSVDLANDRRILRLARFEQFNHARQTAGDVLCLGGFARNLSQHIAGLDLVPIAHHQVGAGRHQVLLPRSPGRIPDQDCRLVFFVSRRQRHHLL